MYIYLIISVTKLQLSLGLHSCPIVVGLSLRSMDFFLNEARISNITKINHTTNATSER